MNAPAAALPEPPEPPASADGLDRPRALLLEWVTVAWNAMEVVVTVSLGLAAQSLALVAFGLDSLVEIFASLVVVWHLGGRGAQSARRRAPALPLVAVAFAVLAAYLLACATHAVLTAQEPESSASGMAYLSVTAVVMFTLAALKRRAGDRAHDASFRAEASMTFLDGCLALGSSVRSAPPPALGWWWADPAAAGVVAVLALGEAGRTWRAAL